MTRHPGRLDRKLPADFRRLLGHARRNDGPSAQRKHHLVPASYLDRWAEDGQLRVTDVNTQHTYSTSPKRAARQTDYYRLESDEIDPVAVPPLLFETMLSSVEGMGRLAIDELLVHEPWEIDRELMAYFTWYLSFQLTRGDAFRQAQRDIAARFFRLTYGDLTDDGIRTLLDAHGMAPTHDAVQEMRAFLDDVRDGTIVALPQDPTLIGMAGETAAKAGEYLLSREWVIYQTPPILTTCDDPVVLIGGPDHRRSERAGVGSAGVIAFPLTPGAVLAMFRSDIAPPRFLTRPELDHAETAELNLEIIANAARWAFERPSRKVTLRGGIPSAPLPSAADDPVPVPGQPASRLIRTYRPTRWANADDPPGWPVAKWWR